jgi:hypothetical protein
MYDILTFAATDQYPILAATQPSLTDVRETLLASVHKKPGGVEVGGIDKEVWTEERCKSFEMERFRPNIVFDCAGEGRPLEAWEEDSWDVFDIGEERHRFYGVSRCARCTVSFLSNVQEHSNLSALGTERRPCLWRPRQRCTLQCAYEMASSGSGCASQALLWTGCRSTK